MKKSIRRQFAYIFIGLMAGAILLCYLANSLFLEQYYIRSKISVIYDAYDTISRAANSDSYGTDEFVDEINAVCNKNNIAICILDSNSLMRYQSSNGTDRMDLELRLLGYIFGREADNQRILAQDREYRLQRVGNVGNEYLELVGRFSTGISFLMRTPLESIHESAALANRFLAIAGICCALMGGIIVWFVTGRITKPILQLNRISEKMVHLDFDARYEGDAHNEIGVLGQNMNQLSASLEKAISELKTANNELQQDIQRKEQIDEMRKEFLSNVSHELKTPIALIQGYAEGLLDGMGDDPTDRDYYCEVIVDEATKMNEMVKKLMSMNQLESGSDVVEFTRFDLTELMAGCISSSEILTKEQGIEVRLKITEPLYVWADAFKTEEVFMNYLSNAMHHCEGEKYIEIGMLEKEDCVRVCVFNTGKPIPEESIDRIWEKFYKVDKARTREYGGSGVGLSIVKAIMDAMHRDCGVENYSNGVLFWFELDRVV